MNTDKLLEALNERFDWYVFAASEEEFNREEINLLYRLLNILDPEEKFRMMPDETIHFNNGIPTSWIIKPGRYKDGK